MKPPPVLLAAALLVAPAPGRAQDVPSGPTQGERVPALKVYDVTGEYGGKEVDYTAERKGRPTVYLFVRADKFDRPMNRFLKALDAAAKKDLPGAYLVAVWLTEDQEKTKELLPRVQRSVRYEATALTCHPGDKAGPNGWGINPDAHLTVVVANKGKAVAVFGYKSVNETDAPAVRKAMEKARPGKREE
jgi:hypothetical protein